MLDDETKRQLDALAAASLHWKLAFISARNNASPENQKEETAAQAAWVSVVKTMAANVSCVAIRNALINRYDVDFTFKMITTWYKVYKG